MDSVNVEDFYPANFTALHDSNQHPLSDVFGTLAAAQAYFPWADGLEMLIDGCAIQLANDYACRRGARQLYIPPGKYVHNFPLFMDGADDFRLITGTTSSPLPRWDPAKAYTGHATFTGTIVGNTLTVVSGLVGTLAIGKIISGFFVSPPCVITGGSGNTWTVSGPSQGVTGAETLTADDVVLYNGIPFIYIGASPAAGKRPFMQTIYSPNDFSTLNNAMPGPIDAFWDFYYRSPLGVCGRQVIGSNGSYDLTWHGETGQYGSFGTTLLPTYIRGQCIQAGANNGSTLRSIIIGFPQVRDPYTYSTAAGAGHLGGQDPSSIGICYPSADIGTTRTEVDHCQVTNCYTAFAFGTMTLGLGDSNTINRCGSFNCQNFVLNNNTQAFINEIKDCGAGAPVVFLSNSRSTANVYGGNHSLFFESLPSGAFSISGTTTPTVLGRKGAPKAAGAVTWCGAFVNGGSLGALRFQTTLDADISQLGPALPIFSGSFQGSISGNTLTVSTVQSGYVGSRLGVGVARLLGAGVSVDPPNWVAAQLTGTSGGAGQYRLQNAEPSPSSGTYTTVEATDPIANMFSAAKFVGDGRVGSFNSFIIVTPNFGAIPLVLIDFNISTRTATLQTFGTWNDMHFGARGDFFSGTDIANEIKAATKLYCSGHAMAFGASVNLYGGFMENWAAPTCLNANQGYSPSIFSGFYLDFDPTCDSGPPTADTSPAAFATQLAQTVFPFLWANNSIKLADWWFPVADHGQPQPALLVAAGEAGHITLENTHVQGVPNLPCCTVNLQKLVGYIPSQNPQFTVWEDGVRAPNNTSLMPSSYPGYDNAWAIGKGKVPHQGFLPELSRTPVLLASDLAIIADSGALAASHPIQFDVNNGHPFLSYPLMAGCTQYQTTQTDKATGTTFDSNHHFYSLFQNLTSANMPPGFRWRAKSHTQHVYITPDAAFAVFQPGRVIGLITNGTSPEFYLITGIYRSLGYVTVWNLTQGLNPNNSGGTMPISGADNTTIYTGTTIYAEPYRIRIISGPPIFINSTPAHPLIIGQRGFIDTSSGPIAIKLPPNNGALVLGDSIPVLIDVSATFATNPVTFDGNGAVIALAGGAPANTFVANTAGSTVSFVWMGGLWRVAVAPANTGVVPGNYGPADVALDAQGHATAASTMAFPAITDPIVSQLPPGPAGLWMMDRYQNTGSRPLVPNLMSASAPAPNLFTASRRMFADTSLWSMSGLSTLTDMAAQAADMTQSATIMVGGGLWFVHPSDPSNLPAGTYTIAASVKSNTTGNSKFSFFPNSFGPDQTVTPVWQRFSQQFVLGAPTPIANIGIASTSAQDGSNIQVCDLELYSGSTDLGPQIYAGHLYLGRSAFDTAPVSAGGLLDMTGSRSQGMIQFKNPMAMGGPFSVMVATSMTAAGTFYQAALSSANVTAAGRATPWQSWTAWLEQNGQAYRTDWDVMVGHANASSGASLTNSRPGLWKRLNQGFKIYTYTYDGKTLSLYVEDIQLFQQDLTLPAMSIADFFFGRTSDSGDWHTGDKFGGMAFYNRALSSTEVAQAVRAFQSRLQGQHFAVFNPDRIVGFVGDSISGGAVGAVTDNPYLFGSAANPPVLGNNWAVSGNFLENDMQATLLNKVLAVVPAPANRAGRKFILTEFFGANAQAHTGAPDGFATALATYCDQLRAGGWFVVATTLLPQTDGLATYPHPPAGNPYPTFEEYRQRVNSILRGWGVGLHYDALNDIGNNSFIMGAPGANLNTSLYQDGLHPSQAGQQYIADSLASILNVITASLVISPAPSAFSSSGLVGGAFSPPSVSYLLSSSTINNTVNYSISGVPTWLTASSTSGNVNSSGTGITFTVNSSANSLAAGTYTGTITFTNTDTGRGNTTLNVTLAVSTASAANYVDAVSGSGSDSNPGTSSQPWATAAHAASVAPGAPLNLKMPNGAYIASPPFANLKALYIAQQGPNSGLLYDVANGRHGTLHGCAFQGAHPALNPQANHYIYLNGTSDYVSLPSTALIGNSDFIVYAVCQETQQSTGDIWSETNTASANTIMCASNKLGGLVTIRDTSNNGNDCSLPPYPSTDPQRWSEFFGANRVCVTGRQGATMFAGLAEEGFALSSAPLGSANVTTNTATIGARVNSSGQSHFWTGNLAAIAIYGAYPNQSTYAAQYDGLRALLYGRNTLIPVLNSDSTLTAGAVWQRQGFLFGGTQAAGGLSSAQEPNAWFEGNPQLLTGGSVFKMLFTSGGIRYAESLTGLPGSWTVAPEVAFPGAQASVVKVAGTYYAYNNNGDNGLTLWTSTDGRHFTRYAGAPNGVVLPLGNPGDWDDQSLFNNSVIVDDDGTWFMLYEARNTAGQLPSYQGGTATSPDGIHWTKSSSNPTFGPDGYSGSGPEIHKIGSTYWVYGHTPQDGGSDIFRSFSNRRDGLFQRYPRSPTFARGDSTTQESGQVADPNLVEANGNVYMFYDFINTGFTSMGIKLAIAPSTTIAQLVLRLEGATSQNP